AAARPAPPPGGPPCPHHPLERHHLQGALRPVTLPAHDQVAPPGVVPVPRKVPAQELELDPHPLPLPPHQPQRLAIRELGPHPQHHEPELRRQRPEQAHHPQLVHRCAHHRPPPQRPPVHTRPTG